MQFLWMTLIVAFRVLGRHRLRSALTMLGMVIGVAAVIAMVSIGEGAKAAVQAQLATFGTNVIIVLPGASSVASQIAGWPTIVPMSVIAGAFAFLGIVGVFFGLYPANKASLLNPMKAIRQE